MKIFAPRYYTDFKCIADRCRHSCCIGWEIDVDAATMKKYAALKGDYSEKIRESIDSAGAPHFRLCENGRCPHLDASGLCKIITEYGEKMLSDICREHPRFYNLTPRGKEVGTGMSCEEAARLILTADDYGEYIQLDECDEESSALEERFDSVSLRDELFAILSDRSKPYGWRRSEIAKRLDLLYPPLSKNSWLSLLPSLEFLDEEHRARFACYSQTPDTPRELEIPLERVLAYLIYRHCSGATSREDFRLSLGFSLFAERLLASLSMAEGIHTVDELIEPSRILSEELEYSEDNTEAIKMEIAFGD